MRPQGEGIRARHSSLLQRPLEITEGIESFPARTPTLPPATHTNSYALGGRDVLLVEPASPFEDEQRAFIQWARGLASSGRRLVGIFLTHHHADHVGGAGVLSRELGLPLWAHERTADRLGNVGVERTLHDGDEILLQGPKPQRWSVLHTPGHAPGHLCLHEPALACVVAGDMVASIGTILIEPGDGDMAVYLGQLERLRRLEARTALPAHGAPIGDPGALFERYIQHRGMRESKILHALAAASPDGDTLDDIVSRAYDDTPQNVWVIARLSLAAHLVKLVREGRVRAEGERYSLSH
jgi:glyoxylase-like metal-dependent hydrolase (beta-lactamase superfamily II)